LINNTKGLMGTGGNPPEEESEYFNKWHYGFSFGGGFRINPKNSPVVVEIMPLNFHTGSNHLMEGFAKIGIDVKLR
jgi:hypothetical protein